MTELFGVPLPLFMGQLLIGLINGSFYAVLSLGLALIFGLLNIVNFAHGAFYMVGAFVAYLLLQWFGIGYWPSLILAPIIVGGFGMVVERFLLRPLHDLDHLYGLLLTFGLALILEGTFRHYYGVSGLPYTIPDALAGAQQLVVPAGVVGEEPLFIMALPNYRGWVIVASLLVCLTTWFLIERTKLGALMRAATENPDLVRAFGVNVPLLITLTYGLGVALAAFAGVLAAPIYSVNPIMGANIIIVVFAIVVIGGLGSILGAIASGFLLGVCEGLTRVFYPEGSSVVIFVVMAIVLIVRPAGLFGKAA
ncbi:branched-chain amino acid ABC transporter permease [Acuticoccus sp.]|uniref:branched-chain amino acid ABC transporter permease n=1 Tax=Acuticoccus sp. TaxID=1904378 RepID=UPI003B52BCBD